MLFSSKKHSYLIIVYNACMYVEVFAISPLWADPVSPLKAKNVFGVMFQSSPLTGTHKSPESSYRDQIRVGLPTLSWLHKIISQISVRVPPFI
jgi:hypothetical protein